MMNVAYNGLHWVTRKKFKNRVNYANTFDFISENDRYLKTH